MPSGGDPWAQGMKKMTRARSSESGLLLLSCSKLPGGSHCPFGSLGPRPVACKASTPLLIRCSGGVRTSHGPKNRDKSPPCIFEVVHMGDGKKT